MTIFSFLQSDILVNLASKKVRVIVEDMECYQDSFLIRNLICHSLVCCWIICAFVVVIKCPEGHK